MVKSTKKATKQAKKLKSRRGGKLDAIPAEDGKLQKLIRKSSRVIQRKRRLEHDDNIQDAEQEKSPQATPKKAKASPKRMSKESAKVQKDQAVKAADAV